MQNQEFQQPPLNAISRKSIIGAQSWNIST